MNYSSCEVSDQNMSGLLQQQTSARKRGGREEREEGERGKRERGRGIEK